MKKNYTDVNDLYFKIIKTDILKYIDANKKLSNCEDCLEKVGSKLNCFECLLPNLQLRGILINLLSNTKIETIYKCQDFLDYKAKKTMDNKFKRIEDIIESYLFFNYL